MFTLSTIGGESSLAVVRNTADGIETCLSWSELEPYWSYSNPEDCDYCTGAVIKDHLVVCLTTACAQGGIVAIKDLRNSTWVYIAQAEFIQAALPLFEYGIIVTKSFVIPNYGNAEKTGHFIEFSKLDGKLDAWEDRSQRIQVDQKEKWVTHPFNTWSPCFEVDRKLTRNATVGLYYDPAGKIVHIIDGEHFYGQVSIADLSFS